jgi:NAD(P)-dependent dehydrogenase (short-subunit alcohol dehydrogenase family)
MFDLTGKTAIVTGARRGIGRGIALALAKAGADIAVADISLEDCQKAVDEIEALGRKGLAVKCDVTQKSEVEEMVAQTIGEFGKVDILVNNAGIAPTKPFLEITEGDWDKVLDINLKGYFLCAQAAAREMVKNGSGKIVNTASVAMGQAGVGFPNLAHYCASKGGVAALTEELCLELTPQGINVNAVAPGVIETAMSEPVLTDPKVKEGLLARIPKKRVGQPEDVAAAVVFLASDEADYISGVVLPVDGGWLAG